MQYGLHTVRGDAQQSALRVLGEMRTTLDSKRLSEDKRREKMHELADQLETLARALLEATIPHETWLPYKLSSLQCRAAQIMHSKMGHYVHKDTFMSALYFDRNPDEVPDAKIIDVTVCAVRQKLAKRNAPFVIENAWGIGYRMIPKPQGIPAQYPVDDTDILASRH